MEPYYAGERVTLYAGDCLDVLRELDDASVDAVVTDPPYGLSATDPKHVVETLTQWLSGNRAFTPSVGGGFMGKTWDEFVPPPAVWDECYRVLKPGGHLLAFAGTRTHDLMSLSIRLAGFDKRDSIAWLYGSGFPKSLDVSKAIDKAAGAEREVVGTGKRSQNRSEGWDRPWLREQMETVGGNGMAPHDITAPATDDARTWQGFGTALKPAFEPVVVARKPLTGTVASNVLTHGTGAFNIAACRIDGGVRPLIVKTGEKSAGSSFDTAHSRQDPSGTTTGRWSANVVLDESQAAALDAMSGELGVSSATIRNHAARPEQVAKGAESERQTMGGFGDLGGASRFYYTAKAPGSERVKLNGTAHPTVKPLDLMRWLVRLVTPPGGLVLDPFAGSGTTVEACLLEGFRCVAIEREPDYLPLIMQRINRRIDPVAAVRAAAEDVGLFDLLGEEPA